MKHISATFAFGMMLLFLAGGAQATCLTVDQVISMNNMLVASNLSAQDRSNILGIFDFLCNRTYERGELDGRLAAIGMQVNATENYTMAALNGTYYSIDLRMNQTVAAINGTIIYHIANYTAWFEDRMNLTAQLGKMADVLQVVYSPDKIGATIDQKMKVYTDDIENKIVAFDENKKNFVLQKDIDDLRSNVTLIADAKISSFLNRHERQGQFSDAAILSFGIIGAVAMYILYHRYRERKRREDIIRAFPRRDSSQHAPLSSDEAADIINSAEIKRKRKEDREQTITEEKEALKEEMMQEAEEDEITRQLKKPRRKV